MRDYNASDWYWFVDGDATKVYSSKVGDFVALNNAAYVAWQGDGSRAVDTESDTLANTLQQLLLRPTSATILDAYKGKQADDVITKIMFKIDFNHENRLRAIERSLGLNGSPPALTPAQARAAVKALM